MATTAPEYTTALRLVAESVAEQRQLAARVITGNLFCWTLLSLILAVIHCYYNNHIDIPAFLSFVAEAVTVLANIVKYSVSGHLEAAEKVGSWQWLYGSEDDTPTKARRSNEFEDLNKKRNYSDNSCKVLRKPDTVLLARHGPTLEIIGTNILQKVPMYPPPDPIQPNMSQKRRQQIMGSPRNWKLIIRAWTMKKGHRGTGIGAWMLKHAIVLCLTCDYQGPEFAKDHANSVRARLPGLNGWVDKMEARAKRRLFRDIVSQSKGTEIADG